MAEELGFSFQYVQDILLHSSQIDCDAHTASFPMGTRSSIQRAKQLLHETDHTPPSGVRVENMWNYNSTASHICVVCCLIKHKDSFTITLHIFEIHSLPFY